MIAPKRHSQGAAGLVLRMKWLRPALFGLLLCLAIGPVAAQAARHLPVIVVPPGNRSASQPTISYSSVRRTADTGGTFAAKYKLVYASLAKDRALIDKIKKTAAVYGIDPIHLIGAIVGEHTYNVDVFDNLQGYYMKALEYVGTNVQFAYLGQPIDVFVERPEFKACAEANSDYDLWTCREDVWRKSFQGKKVDGVAYPDDRFE